MPNRSISFALAALLVASSLLAGDKLSKDDKKWLELVRPILLPEEERIYRDLKKGERKSFQEIFWARRDPDTKDVSADNSFKKDYLAARKTADERYRVRGSSGGETHCGRTFLLLGEPQDMERGQFGAVVGTRPPETWTYRGDTFTDGEIQIDFDETCSVQDGVGWSAQLTRLAEAKITRPQLGYHKNDKGKLIKLADQLPKPSPALTLLQTPRQDFALAAEPKLSMRAQEGGATYIAGLVRGDAAGFETSERDGRRIARLTLAVEAIDAEGRSAIAGAKELEAPVEDGEFTASYSVTLRPGQYRLKVGTLDPKSEAGSVVEIPVESRDFGGAELMVSDPLIFSEMQQRQQADQKDPLAAFLLGTNQVVPRFGNAFEQSEAIQIISMVYGAPADEATGQASVGATYTILKDDKPISRSQEAEYTSVDCVPAVGPIPLSGFEPGEYSVELSLKDKLSDQVHKRQIEFSVR